MLIRILVGPLFGAALASGWWAWAIWGDGQVGPTAVNPDGGIVGLLLVLASAAYGVLCVVAACLDVCKEYDAAHPSETGKESDE